MFHENFNRNVLVSFSLSLCLFLYLHLPDWGEQPEQQLRTVCMIFEVKRLFRLDPSEGNDRRCQQKNPKKEK
jgi:hypothetical protein